MKLLTQEIRNRIPPLYSTDGTPVSEKIIHAKFFTPDSSWTWFAFEFDAGSKVFFVLACGLENELGYVSLDDLETATGHLGVHIERDLHFGDPIKAKDVRNEPALAAYLSRYEGIEQPATGTVKSSAIEQHPTRSLRARDYIEE